MDITWYGLSCFRIAERGLTTVVTDPYSTKVGLTLPKLKGDVVTSSHDAAGHNNLSGVAGHAHALTGPGEYEIGGVFITGVATHKADVRNLHFVFNYGSIKVAHLGDIAQIPTKTQIEAMGAVNILLLPVGSGSGLNASQASEVVSMIDPNIIIPMHYSTPGLKIELEPLDRFLKEMGIGEFEHKDVLKVSYSSLPEEPQTVVLTPKL